MSTVDFVVGLCLCRFDYPLVSCAMFIAINGLDAGVWRLLIDSHLPREEFIRKTSGILDSGWEIFEAPFVDLQNETILSVCLYLNYRLRLQSDCELEGNGEAWKKAASTETKSIWFCSVRGEQ